MSKQSDRQSTDNVHMRAHAGICIGVFVHLDEFNRVQAAGPILHMPKPQIGWTTLFNPQDFERMLATALKLGIDFSYRKK